METNITESSYNLLYITIIGFISGVITVGGSFIMIPIGGGSPNYLLPGLVFGFAICFYFVKLRKQNLSGAKIIGFIFVSVIAFFAAFYSTLFAPLIIHTANGTVFSSGSLFGGDSKFDPTIFLLGGLVGAFLLTLGIKFILFSLKWSRILILSLAGGLLGFIGVFVDPQTVSFWTLFIIWQTGMAFILGIIFRIDTKEVIISIPQQNVVNIIETKPKGKNSGKILAGLFILFLAYISYSRLSFNHSMEGAIKQDDISNPNIVVNSNIGGKSWGAGSSQQIFWNAPSVVKKVNITLNDYPSNGISTQIASGILSPTSFNSSYNWIVPQDISAGQYTINVIDTGSSGLVGISRPIGIYNGDKYPTEQTYSGTVNFTNQSNPSTIDFNFQYPTSYFVNYHESPISSKNPINCTDYYGNGFCVDFKDCSDTWKDAEYCVRLGPGYDSRKDNAMQFYVFKTTQLLQDWCTSHSGILSNCTSTTINKYQSMTASTPQGVNPKIEYKIVKGNSAIILFATTNDRIPEFNSIVNSIQFTN